MVFAGSANGKSLRRVSTFFECANSSHLYLLVICSGNSVPQPAGGGYNRRNNPYAQQDDNRYEMNEVTTHSRERLGGGGGDDLTTFYDEISSIQDQIAHFNDNVQRVSDLHSRSLNSMDDQAAARNAEQLDSLVEETSSLSNQIKLRIKDLERKAGGRDANAKKQQTGVVKQKFLESIQNYQSVERQYRTKYKQRMERQFKIGGSQALSPFQRMTTIST